jgi:hypothetical protein
VLEEGSEEVQKPIENVEAAVLEAFGELQSRPPTVLVNRCSYDRFNSILGVLQTKLFIFKIDYTTRD